ncbi:MAG: HEAT repeat domain-containing protein [Bacteroidota bacterium]
MEVPSMKILYQSLDSRERYDIQARIDGTVNEITAFSAGLIMAGLAMLSFVHIIHFTYILIFVLAAWVFIGLALYRRYRLSLEESLTMARSEAKPLLRQQYFESLQEDQLQHTAGMLRINPFFIHHVARKGADPYLFSEDGEVRAEAWNMIANSLYRPDPEKTKKLLLQESDKAIRMIAESMLSRPLPSGRETGAALRSGTRETILGALESLAAEGRKDLIPQLISLLRDVDPFVRKAAIDAAGKLASIELGPYLVDYLGHPDLGYNAWSALVCSGEGVLGNLENAFHRSGQSTAVQIRIIHAMSAIGGPSAEAYLAQKLSYHQREVRHAVIKALHDSGYRPREDVRQPVLDAIYSSVAVGAWIIAAEQTIRENNPGNGLLEAIREELRFNNHQLFMLLGIAYDRQVVDHVKDSLTREESDDSGYAIELLNLIVDEQVKEYLEPYFDDRSAADKIRLLQNEFPVEILSFENLVEEILTRDGLWLGHYVRACAIDALGEEKRFMAGMQLAAQAFHPQRVISELSLRTLLKQAPETYRQIVERTGKPEEKEQEQLLNGSLLQPHPVMERMKELRNWDLFREVPWQELFFLAEIMEEANKEKIVDRNFVTFFRDLSTFESNDATGLLFFPDSDEQIRNEELAREKTGPGKPVYVVRVDLLKNMMFTYRGIHSAVMHFFETELETI